MNSTVISRNRTLSALLALCLLGACAPSRVQHTFYSQFTRPDSIQVAEIWAPEGVLDRMPGHHGPAVENQYMALRFYFDARGAIDVYNKSGRIDNELGRWLWYPTPQQQQEEGAGGDDYYVGKTVGLGGVRLWDGEKEIPLETTAGRRSLVGRTEAGAFMEMIAYGVLYQGETVDISLRVDVFDDSRWARVSVRELNGKAVRYTTGINYHPGAEIRQEADGLIAVWGVHPANISAHPAPIGAAIRYNPADFPEREDNGEAFRLFSTPLPAFCTWIVSASTKESELGSAERFFPYVSAYQEFK